MQSYYSLIIFSTFQVHGALELFGLLILGLELGIRLKWLGLKTFIKHKRTLIKVYVKRIQIVKLHQTCRPKSSNFAS
jgi:hypothetical protein